MSAAGKHVGDSAVVVQKSEAMLLHLTADTWADEARSKRLAADVVEAMRKRLRIILAHEMPGVDDAKRHACNFELFFSEVDGHSHTPRFLKDANLYSTIAAPLKGGVFREISFGLLMRGIAEAPRQGMPNPFQSDEDLYRAATAFMTVSPAELAARSGRRRLKAATQSVLAGKLGGRLGSLRSWRDTLSGVCDASTAGGFSAPLPPTRASAAAKVKAEVPPSDVPPGMMPPSPGCPTLPVPPPVRASNRPPPRSSRAPPARHTSMKPVARAALVVSTPQHPPAPPVPPRGRARIDPTPKVASAQATQPQAPPPAPSPTQPPSGPTPPQQARPQSPPAQQQLQPPEHRLPPPRRPLLQRSCTSIGLRSAAATAVSAASAARAALVRAPPIAPRAPPIIDAPARQEPAVAAAPPAAAPAPPVASLPAVPAVPAVPVPLTEFRPPKPPSAATSSCASHQPCNTSESKFAPPKPPTGAASRFAPPQPPTRRRAAQPVVPTTETSEQAGAASWEASSHCSSLTCSSSSATAEDEEDAVDAASAALKQLSQFATPAPPASLGRNFRRNAR
jgi:hypothetical protein